MLKEIISVIESWKQAHHIILRFKLWKWVLVPGILYTLLFITGIYFFVSSATGVIERVTDLFNLTEWIKQFENSFAGFLFTFSGLTLWLTLFLFYFSFLKYTVLIAGAPLFTYLSRKTEAIIKGVEIDRTNISREIGLQIVTSLRNCAWQTFYLLLMVLASVIPVAGWIVPLVALFFECYYFGFSILGYGFARHEVQLKNFIPQIRHYKGLAIGNGILFYLLHLALIFAPAYAIIGSTLSVHNFLNTPHE